MKVIAFEKTFSNILIFLVGIQSLIAYIQVHSNKNDISNHHIVLGNPDKNENPDEVIDFGIFSKQGVQYPIITYKKDGESQYSLSQASVRSLFKDKDGNIGLDRNLGFIEGIRKGFNAAVDGEDGLLEKVRLLCGLISDDEIVQKLVTEKIGTPEQVWFCLKSAEILDGK